MDNVKEPFVVKSNEAPFIATRLLDHEGNFHQKVEIKAAIQIAKNVDMDLVCFNEPENTSLALCKIIDYGKWKYQAEKNNKKIAKKQSHSTKEIRFSPVIGAHDIQHKVKQIKEIIEEGDTVIVNMQIHSKRLTEEAKHKVEEIINLCSVFSKEVSRKPSERSIFITLTKK